MFYVTVIVIAPMGSSPKECRSCLIWVQLNKKTHPGLLLLSRLLVGGAVVSPELVEVDDVRVVDVGQDLEDLLQLVLLVGLDI